MKKLNFNLRISKIIFSVISISNLLLPLYYGSYMHFNIFQLIVVILWLYAILSQHGFFKTQITSNLDDGIFYEANIPLTPVAIVRAAELIYFLVFKRDLIDWRIFILFIFLDVLYSVFLLLDKSKYYFEESEDRTNDTF